MKKSSIVALGYLHTSSWDTKVLMWLHENKNNRMFQRKKEKEKEVALVFMLNTEVKCGSWFWKNFQPQVHLHYGTSCQLLYLPVPSSSPNILSISGVDLPVTYSSQFVNEDFDVLSFLTNLDRDHWFAVA